MQTSRALATVLTISGFDSGGRAGIPGDLKTFSALNVFGLAAVTGVTTQSPTRLSALAPMNPRMVKEQIQNLCEAYPVAAAKTGLLFSAEIVRAVAEADQEYGIPILVVDPVMKTVGGDRLLQPDAIELLRDELLHAARVVTPNLHEAEAILGRSIASVADLRAAAREIGEKYDVACVAMGGKMGGAEVVDVLFDEGEETVFRGPRINLPESQGCGSAFSAALAAYLGRGYLLAEAVHAARDYVVGALEHALHVGAHRPLHYFWNASLNGPF